MLGLVLGVELELWLETAGTGSLIFRIPAAGIVKCVHGIFCIVEMDALLLNAVAEFLAGL